MPFPGEGKDEPQESGDKSGRMNASVNQITAASTAPPIPKRKLLR
jgi:hypothetical protein